MENSTDKLSKIFKLYTKTDMKGRTFVKLLKESKIINKKYSSTSVDIIFARIKTKGKNSITFKEFLNGINEIAKEQKVKSEVLIKKISNLKGPNFKGTKAKYNKFHDDKKNYTGVHKNGGPDSFAKGGGKINDISEITNRKKADVRGISK